MKKNFFPFLLVLLTACATSKKGQKAAVSPLQQNIDSVSRHYAPDKRTALFDITAEGKKLKGYTNLPAAKAALLQQLQTAGLAYEDSIQLLPLADLQGMHYAVVINSVANLRTQPRHPAELATQATLGTPLRVWKKEKGWYLVQMPDQYLAWVDGGGITLLNDHQFTQWQQKEKIIYTQPYGFVYTAPNTGGATVSDLVFGAVLDIDSVEAGFYKVSFADGRTGYVPATGAVLYKEWATGRQPSIANLVTTAQRLMGLPYLWGGTSFKGVDCSGFTKTVYFMNGLVLPRDASQQVHLGDLVDTQHGWEKLQPGDLLFFGAPAQEGKPERVVHVGMWIGNTEFIHAAGRVQVSSFNPRAANFDAAERKRFLRAKRIAPQAALKDLRTASFF